MNKNYRGACERGVDHRIAGRDQTIEINWINMSAKEAGSGGADRITRKLIDAGYRPDGSGCAARYREDYESGRKVDGKYIRMPQETWLRGGDSHGEANMSKLPVAEQVHRVQPDDDLPDV